MQPEDIKFALETAIEGSQAQVEFEGSHVKIDIVSDAFEGVRPVKRQQMVYGVLSDAIASGAIHAVHIHAKSLREV